MRYLNESTARLDKGQERQLAFNIGSTSTNEHTNKERNETNVKSTGHQLSFIIEMEIHVQAQTLGTRESEYANG